MPFVIAALGALATAYFYYMRARGAANVASELVETVTDVGKAARRFRFKRRANVHPVESVDEPEIAIAAIAAAFVEMDPASSKDMWDRLTVAIAKEFGLSGAEAQELAVLGRWLVAQCGTVDAAVTRLSRKLYKLAGSPAITPLLTVVQTTLTPEDGQLSESQRGALQDISRALHIR